MLPDGKQVTRLYSLDHSDLYISNDANEMICRLILGIPHSLILSNNNGELQILVPTLQPFRPKIGDSPFSTTLVLNRGFTTGSQGWLCDARYFLYPVHVSFSFLFMPTLCSAMYMILLRFLNMNFSESCKLSPSVATDANLTADELKIFMTVIENQLKHPDSYAFLLHFFLALSQSPSCLTCASQSVPSIEVAYLKRLSHVSYLCRLDRSDELRLIESFGIHSTSDKRSFGHTWELIYMSNRKKYLISVIQDEREHGKEKDNEVKKIISVSLPARLKNAHWIWQRELDVFKLDEPIGISHQFDYLL